MSEASGAGGASVAAFEEEPRPIPRLLLSVGLALVVCVLVLRTFTTGGGIELLAPGAHLLFDVLAFAAVAVVAAARLLEGEAPLARSGARLPALALLAALLAIGAARAPYPDLAWRTAATWIGLLLLALTCRDLARDPRLARLLTALLVACVLTGALLGLHDALIERPALREALERGELDEELALHDASFRAALEERIRAVAAVGPWLLPGLLASAVCATLPLLGALAWRLRRRPLGAVPAGALVVAAATLLAARSKGAVVTLAVVGAALTLLHPRLAHRRRQVLAALAVLGALVGGLGLAAFLAGPERVGVGLSLTVRLEYWSAGLGMLGDHPLLGVGVNQFREFYGAYKPLRAEETLHAHNALVQVLAEGGLVGLAAWTALIVAWVWEGVGTCLAPAVARAEETAGEAWPARLWAGPAAGLGVALLLLRAHGDAAAGGELIAIAALVPLLTFALTRALTRALERAPGDPRLLGAAAVAGAAALLGDGLLNFGLHHPGLFAVTFTLAALAPALAGRGDEEPERWTSPPALRLAAGAACAALTLALGFSLLPRGLEADVQREGARAARDAGALALARGEPQRAAAALTEAAEAYERAAEAWPWDPRTHLEHAETFRLLAEAVPEQAAPLQEAAVAEARAAVAAAPRTHSAWNELGQLLASGPAPDPAAAREAFDRAAALYPGHPGYQLDAARARAAEVERLPAGDPAAAALRAEALERLRRAEEASETTRLIRRKLSEEQRRDLRLLRARLGSD